MRCTVLSSFILLFFFCIWKKKTSEILIIDIACDGEFISLWWESSQTLSVNELKYRGLQWHHWQREQWNILWNKKNILKMLHFPHMALAITYSSADLNWDKWNMLHPNCSNTRVTCLHQKQDWFSCLWFASTIHSTIFFPIHTHAKKVRKYSKCCFLNSKVRKIRLNMRMFMRTYLIFQVLTQI